LHHTTTAIAAVSLPPQFAVTEKKMTNKKNSFYNIFSEKYFIYFRKPEIFRKKRENNKSLLWKSSIQKVFQNIFPWKFYFENFVSKIISKKFVLEILF